ncbi:MAG TPA: hypothetical protein VN777_00250 [Terriglobales bacterium]|nr:hypothetical protein [Terriglobales bacterium]
MRPFLCLVLLAEGGPGYKPSAQSDSRTGQGTPQKSEAVEILANVLKLTALFAEDNLSLVFLQGREQTQSNDQKGAGMDTKTFRKLWGNDEGQDIAEYAVMLAVILVLVVGTIRLIGSSSNNVFSSVASSIGQ